MKTYGLAIDEKRSQRKPLRTCPDCGAAIGGAKKRCMPCADIASQQQSQARARRRYAERKAAP